jgi:hypothetical protein
MPSRTATDAVTMICPNLACRRTVSAPASARGTTVRCAYCQQPFRVPAAPQQEREPGQRDDDSETGRRSAKNSKR